MLKLSLDGKEITVVEGSTLNTVLPDRRPGQSIGIISPKQVSESETREFLILTSAGEIVVEAVRGTNAGTILSGFNGLNGGWQDLKVASFGPFKSSFTPARKPSGYERGDLVIGCGGYDPGRSFLILCRKTHAADHGAAADGGVIAKVISGRGVMDRLVQEDRIISVKPVISFAESSDAITTTDGSTVLHDGMHLITHIRVQAEGFLKSGYDLTASESVDLMLLAMQDSEFVVDGCLSNHIRCDILAGTPVPAQVFGARLEGSVYMRISGKKRGSLYIYTQDLPGSQAHTRVGEVTHGIELCKIAHEGDRLSIIVEPQQFDLVGLSLDEARKKAEALNITLIPDKEGSERVVIGQDPPATLKVLDLGSVNVNTIPDEQVISISLDDLNAPRTCRIFREVTGLKYHAVGKLPFLFSFDEVTLFKSTIPKTTHVIPENIPETTVSPGILAMTNDSCKGVGIVGVRAVASSEFGPTSEPFSGTNQIGLVIDMNKIAGLEEGEVVYFREVR